MVDIMGKDLSPYHRLLRGIPLIIMTTLVDVLISSVFSQMMMMYLISLGAGRTTALVASVVGAIFCYAYICYIRQRVTTYIRGNKL